MTDTTMHERRVRLATLPLVVLLGACPGDPEGDGTSATSGLTNGPDATASGTTQGLPPPGESTGGPDTATTTPPPPPDPDSGSDGPPPPPPPRCDGTPVGGDIALIDDLEVDEGAMESDGQIHPVDGRVGFWFTYNDATAGAMQEPESPFLPQPGGVGGSEYAARTWGDGFTDWGAGMAVSINNDFSGDCPYDASNFDGISFWARGTGSVRFHLATVATTPVDSGGTCTGTCYDNFGTSVELTDEWTQVVVTWDELSQEGWGDAADFETGELMQIHWQMAPSEPFDVYIDDLSFWPEDEDMGGSSGSTGGSGSSTG